jgi:hypothetical protein
MARRVRNVFLCLVALASGVALVWWGNAVLQLDAFARLRARPGEVQDPISIRLRDFDIRQWHGDKLMTYAHVDRMDIGRYQNYYELFGVDHGRYAGAEEPFGFEASHAVYSDARRTLEGFDKVHVYNARYNLTAAGFQYSTDSKMLDLAGVVTGVYDKARLSAVKVRYDTAHRRLTTGPAELQGQAESPGDDEKPKPWTFKAPKGLKADSDGGDDAYVAQDVWATDGTIIVRAGKCLWNKKSDVLTLFAPVRYWSPKADAICDHAVIYRKARRALFTGHVTMVVKPKDHEVVDEKVVVQPFTPSSPKEIDSATPPPTSFEHREASKPSPAKAVVETPDQKKDLDDELRSNETVRKYPATIYAEKIEYFYKKGERHAFINGSPQAQQELPGARWRRVWADHAYYDGEKETLRLMSPATGEDVVLKDSVGEDYLTAFYLTSTKDDGKFIESGATYGKFISEDDEANEAARKAGEKTKPKPGEKGTGKGG